LIHVVPFAMVNAVMGLSHSRTRTFWWASQIGMLPMAVLYVMLGSSFTSLDELAQHGVQRLITPRLVVTFIALGLLPLAISAMLRRRRKSLEKSFSSREKVAEGLMREE
jgi:uncharacterized membrane protein YdjX (TVP38/TMEM64 family)